MAYAHMQRRVRVLDSYILYSDSRAGEHTAIFLHGNATSSCVWRHVIPRLQGLARCLAPDLLGFGQSGPEPNDSYQFEDQYRYFCEWMKSIKVHGKCVFVCQDLGSMLAFRWAAENEATVKAIVHMESIVAPFAYTDIENALASELIYDIRHDWKATGNIVHDNNYVERYLECIVNNRKYLKEPVLSIYKKPLLDSLTSRLALIATTRDLPVIGEGPRDVHDAVAKYSAWLANSSVPKLYIHAKGGVFGGFIERVTSQWTNHVTIPVPGGHLVQETSAEDIAGAIVTFIKRLDSFESVQNGNFHVRWFD